MFFENFQITFSATLQVLILATCGYLAVRLKWLNDQGLDQMTSVLVNLLLPCFSFVQLTQHFNFGNYSFWWQLPLLYIGMAVAALVLASIMGFGFKGRRRNEFLALVGFQNCGNIPLVVVAALFTGDTAHTLFVYIVLFIIGANILIWTLGVWLLLQGENKTIDIKKMINPPLLTTLLTLVLVWLGAERFIPKTVLKPVEMLGNCALPMAMFTVGGNLAGISLKKVQPVPALLLVFSKLIMFPALALWLVLSLKVNPLMGFLIVLQAAVPSAITLSLIGRYYNIKEEFVSEGVLISHVVSVVTVPIFLTIYLKMVGPF